jgi:hypothetical protein
MDVINDPPRHNMFMVKFKHIPGLEDENERYILSYMIGETIIPTDEFWYVKLVGLCDLKYLSIFQVWKNKYTHAQGKAEIEIYDKFAEKVITVDIGWVTIKNIQPIQLKWLGTDSTLSCTVEFEVNSVSMVKVNGK